MLRVRHECNNITVEGDDEEIKLNEFEGNFLGSFLMQGMMS